MVQEGRHYFDDKSHGKVLKVVTLVAKSLHYVSLSEIVACNVAEVESDSTSATLTATIPGVTH